MAHDVYIAGASYKDVSIVTLTDAAGNRYRYIDEEEVGDGFFTLDMEGDLTLKNEITWSQCFKLDAEENIVLQDAPGASKYFGPDEAGDVTLVGGST
ncbi:MAG: hypothetical protein MR506_07385 [Dialister sp.]|nr:hypothetical protein [Dialister sp.]